MLCPSNFGQSLGLIDVVSLFFSAFVLSRLPGGKSESFVLAGVSFWVLVLVVVILMARV